MTVGLEVRDADGKPCLVGYAAKYNTRSKPIYGMFIETIAPGAFTRTLKSAINVRALYNHKSDNLLGSTRAGTLKLSEDSTGLLCEISPPDTQVGRDVTELIRRGDIYGMSFAFGTKEDRWLRADKPDELDLRTLLDVDLYDVSPVTDPAYEDTEVSVRAHEYARTQWQGEITRMKMQLDLLART